MRLRVPIRLKWLRSSFSGTSTTPARTTNSVAPIRSLIDDGALNFVGLDPSDAASADDAVTAALAIPVNRPVELRLRSKDVIHNFWVPQLRFKQDLVPGMEIKVHFTANRVGKYELACAELCGQLHFKMKSYMLVLPEDEIAGASGFSAGAVPGAHGGTAGEVSTADKLMIANLADCVTVCVHKSAIGKCK